MTSPISVVGPGATPCAGGGRRPGPVEGTRTQVESAGHAISDYVAAALAAGLAIEHVSEHRVDAALATSPRAEKYLGRPMLFLMKAAPSCAPGTAPPGT